MKSCTEIFACKEEDATGRSVLITSPAQVQCSATSTQYVLLCIFASAFFFLYFFGINFLASYFASYSGRVTAAIRLDYKESKMWWFEMTNVYKLVSVCALTLLPLYPMIQIWVMLGATCTIALMMACVKPHMFMVEDEEQVDATLSDEWAFYRKTGELPNNLLEIFLYSVQVLTLVIFLIYYEGGMPDLLMNILVGIIFSVCLYVVGRQLYLRFKGISLK